MTATKKNPPTNVRPFLKWAGGKYMVVDRIKKLLPPGTRFVEPFLGSAVVFLNVDYSAYLLADVNQDLINLYNTLKELGSDFIKYCESLFIPANNNKEQYYKNRDLFNSTADIRLRSALFLYLNRHGYNGLCRYNSSGKFNVPFGSYKKPYFPKNEMYLFWEKAQYATFLCKSFDEVMSTLVSGDVVYCDPPYVPLSITANFTGYSSESFGLKEQSKLARFAENLSRKGIPVVISNHSTSFTLQEYSIADIEEFQVQRNISRNGNGRVKVKELLAVYK